MKICLNLSCSIWAQVDRRSRRDLDDYESKKSKSVKFLKKYYNLLKRSALHISYQQNKPLKYFPLMSTRSKFLGGDDDGLAPKRYEECLYRLFDYCLILHRENSEEVTKQMTETTVGEGLDVDDPRLKGAKNLKNVYLVLDHLHKLIESSKSGIGMFPIPRIG